MFLIIEFKLNRKSIIKEIKLAEKKLIEVDVKEELKYVRDLINKRNFLKAKQRCIYLLEKKLSKEDEVEVRFRLSLCYVSLKQYQNSKEELERVLRIGTSKRKADAIFLIARLYEDKFKDLKNAKKYYKMYLSKYPDGRLSGIARKKIFNLK